MLTPGVIFSLLQKRRARIRTTPSMAKTVPTRALQIETVAETVPIKASHATAPFPMSPGAPWAYSVIPYILHLFCVLLFVSSLFMASPPCH